MLKKLPPFGAHLWVFTPTSVNVHHSYIIFSSVDRSCCPGPLTRLHVYVLFEKSTSQEGSGSPTRSESCLRFSRFTICYT